MWVRAPGRRRPSTVRRWAGLDAGRDAGGMADEWYWSLAEQRAVHRTEKGPADQVLGPYPSKDAAEHWRERVDQRNEAWDDQDEAWEGDDDDEED
jgi:hypothetical protein